MSVYVVLVIELLFLVVFSLLVVRAVANGSDLTSVASRLVAHAMSSGLLLIIPLAVFLCFCTDFIVALLK